MSLPREVVPGCFYKLTRRCTQRQFLMRPDEGTNNTYLYCLAEAASRYGIIVILTTAMSNHHHTDVFDPFGLINEFMEQFHKMFAKAMNAYRGRWENFWSSEPPCLVRLIDPSEILGSLVYTATNPVKDGLVERVADWPGVNGLSALLEQRTIVVTRPKHFFRADGPMPETVTLQLSFPPELGDPDQLREDLRKRVAAAEEAFAKDRAISGQRVVGRVAILRQSWRAAPKSLEPRRDLRPTFAAKSLWAQVEALARKRAFLDAYRRARHRWLAGLETVFPAGTYWLRRFAGVPVAAAQS